MPFSADWVNVPYVSNNDVASTMASTAVISSGSFRSRDVRPFARPGELVL
jgi:hypothetical protein